MFVWKNDYSCNIAEIDAQHKRLFELAGDLYAIATSKDDVDYYDDICRIFKELSDYTVYHFSYEEQLMEQHGYDQTDCRAHKWEHAAFVAKIQKIQESDLDMNQRKVLMEVIMFAVDWIEKHILTTDKKYSEFFNAKGII